MASIDLSPIQELYHLWKPVYPYLLRQIEEIYGRRGGAILEVGPFCGTIFAFKKEELGDSLSVATFPAGMGGFYLTEAKLLGIADSVGVFESDAFFAGVKENSINLVIFRGALFFPSLFQVDFSSVYRILKDDGVALIGGGFGKYTPRVVVEHIAKRSRELNLQAGKVEVSKDEVLKRVGSELMPGHIEIVSEGGLWVIMKK